jgi:putative methyltransferase (TIGR04325 family)
MTPHPHRRSSVFAREIQQGLRGIVRRVDPVVAAVRAHVASEMTYLPDGWSRTDGGWTDPGVVEAQARHWPTLVANLDGRGPLGVSHLPWSSGREDRTHHNAMMSYGYVLARAARHRDRISVLDWGGGAGHYYLYSRALLPELDLDYHCVELPMFCDLGRRLLPEVRFHEAGNGLPYDGGPFDLVVASGALHYAERWRDVARDLASETKTFLYLARLQTVAHAASFAAVHRVDRAGYREFVSWCINRDELVDAITGAGLALVREFVHAEPWVVRGAPERPETRGFLFERTRVRG